MQLRRNFEILTGAGEIDGEIWVFASAHKAVAGLKRRLAALVRRLHITSGPRIVPTTDAVSYFTGPPTWPISSFAHSRRGRLHRAPGNLYALRTFLIDRNRILSFIAFCATAPRVRRSFLAASGCDSFAFAKASRFFTSSFDHANTITCRFRFAIDAPF